MRGSQAEKWGCTANHGPKIAPKIAPKIRNFSVSVYINMYEDVIVIWRSREFAPLGPIFLFRHQPPPPPAGPPHPPRDGVLMTASGSLLCKCAHQLRVKKIGMRAFIHIGTHLVRRRPIHNVQSTPYVRKCETLNPRTNKNSGGLSYMDDPAAPNSARLAVVFAAIAVAPGRQVAAAARCQGRGRLRVGDAHKPAVGAVTAEHHARAPRSSKFLFVHRGSIQEEVVWVGSIQEEVVWVASIQEHSRLFSE
eukprot:351983-Chlamydomonas_euryale.AAC.2